MKWIKPRDLFLEAKLRDVILPRQAKAVTSKWGEKYLDYEEVTPTNKIEQGSWKLSEEDKNDVLGVFCQTDMPQLFTLFSSLPEQFGNVLNQSINTDLFREDKATYERIFEGFDIRKPKLDQILAIFSSVFRKLSIPDTMATSVISKDESNRPIRDEQGNMIRVEKKPGDLAFSNNLININSFIVDYNDLVDKCIDANVEGWSTMDKIASSNLFSENRNLGSFINFAATNENTQYKLDFEIFNKDIFLKISHNPKDILNMSISKFYSSCQHLYSGGYSDRVLANVFDPNSIPAFLIFETPIFWEGEKISEHLPLSRMIIRNLESFDSIPKQGTNTTVIAFKLIDTNGLFINNNIKTGDIVYNNIDKTSTTVVSVDSEVQLTLSGNIFKETNKPYAIHKATKLYFDRAYPDRMQDKFEEIVTKYSGNIMNADRNDRYLYTPDLDTDDNLTAPYQDRLSTTTGRMIGKNIKTLYLSQIGNWKNVRVDPNARIKELIIETTEIPDSLLTLNITLDWIKFKFIEIHTLKDFDRIKTTSIAFDKCKLSNGVLQDINQSNPNITKLQIISCDNVGSFDFSEFKALEELQVIYTLDSVEDLKTIVPENLKKLVISGDLATKESKSILGSLRSKGVKIEIVGPII
jgi:hypothetical protein